VRERVVADDWLVFIDGKREQILSKAATINGVATVCADRAAHPIDEQATVNPHAVTSSHVSYL